MDATQEQNMIRDYGITDAEPVLKWYKKVSDEGDRVMKDCLFVLRARIAYDLQKSKAEKILKKSQ